MSEWVDSGEAMMANAELRALFEGDRVAGVGAVERDVQHAIVEREEDVEVDLDGVTLEGLGPE